jgi:hypothetical protein
MRVVHIAALFAAPEVRDGARCSIIEAEPEGAEVRDVLRTDEIQEKTELWWLLMGSTGYQM